MQCRMSKPERGKTFIFRRIYFVCVANVVIPGILFGLVTNLVQYFVRIIVVKTILNSP